MMAKQITSTLEGKEIRFAPTRGTEPATSIWRIWAEKNELYAISRGTNSTARISMHSSGQVHCRLGDKKKQDMVPPMPGTPPWSHVLELRFLLSDDALSPFKQRESLKKNSAY